MIESLTSRKVPISPIGFLFSCPSIQVQTGGQLVGLYKIAGGGPLISLLTNISLHRFVKNPARGGRPESS
jgi:hypothetical protein